MNTLRNSLRMARKDLKILFKDRGQLAVVFALPLLFSLLYGGMAANRRYFPGYRSSSRKLP